MIDIFVFIVLLLSLPSALGRGVLHNDIQSYPEYEMESVVSERSNGNPIWRDAKLANEFQLIEPQYIRESTFLSSADDAVNVKGTYIIFKPERLVIDNNDVVNLTFYSSNPKDTDWIGAYSPANLANNLVPSPLKSKVPVKYGFCDENIQYLKTGYGFLTFNFTNLRADISFVYFVNSTGKNAVAVNRSDFNVSFSNFNEPLRPRVVATGNANIYNLLWSSYNSTKPTLKWGTTPNKYTNVVSASTGSIPFSEMCGAPATTIGWRDLGLIHTAAFIGMLALSNQRIFYIFGDEDTNDYSDEFTLQVAPKAGTQPANRGTRAILYDDLGRGSRDMTMTWYEYGRPAIRTAEMVAPEIADGLIDVVYHGGDISYATGYLSVWDFFANMMSPVTSGVLYLTTVGNHETDWPNSPSYWNVTDSGGECGYITTTMYTQPAPSVTNKPWWSYDVGLIHFVGMSTEHNFTTGSEQWHWLRNDLANVDRSVTPWVVFGGHRAMYLNSDYCCSKSTTNNPLAPCLSGCAPTSDYALMWDMVAHIEPLLFKYKVNFAFYGHNHVVQRQSAVYNYTVVQKSKPRNVDGNKVNFYEDPQATVHFIIGTGGATFTKSAMPKGSPYFPAWNELYFYEYGYARIEAVNATYLTYEWVVNSNGTVLDRAVIYQKDPFSMFNGSASLDVDDDNLSDDNNGDSASEGSDLDRNTLIGIVAAACVALVAVCIIYYVNKSKSVKDDSDYHDIDVKPATYSPLTQSTSTGDISIVYQDEPIFTSSGYNPAHANSSPLRNKSISKSSSPTSAKSDLSIVTQEDSLFTNPSPGMKKVRSFDIMPISPSSSHP